MKQRQITLRAPLGGVDRRLGFQSQPPFTTPAARNFLADDVHTGRARGGARPGLSKAITTDRDAFYQFLGVVNTNVGEGVVTYQRTVIAIESGHALYADEGDTTWTEVAGGPYFNPSVLLEAAPREQKLYIADYANANGDDGVTTSGQLTSATITDWTTVGITASNLDQWTVELGTTATVEYPPWVELPPGATGSSLYAITSLDNGNSELNLNPNPGDDTGIVFRLHRTPKVWDLATHTITDWETEQYVSGEVGYIDGGGDEPKGVVPMDCRLICEYQDRLILSGNIYNPNAWFAPRSGNPLDFDYGISDVTSAVAYSNYQGGQLGEPVTALIPHGFDCLLIGCTASQYVMRGNPANTSSHLFKTDDKVGILGARAWCKTPHDETVILNRDGLYYMPSGCGVAPTSISREKLPVELTGLQADDYTVNLAFDLLLRCVHIWVIPTNNAQTECWLYNWEHKAFWPVLMTAGHQPWSTCDYEPIATANKSSIILGGYDGVCRVFDKDAVDDDGTDFASYVNIGPFMLASNIDNKGTVQRLRIITGTDSGAVSWAMAADTTAEAVNAQMQATNYLSSNTGTVDAYAIHPRCTGSAGMLRLFADGSATQWTVEEAVCQYRESGRMR